MAEFVIEQRRPSERGADIQALFARVGQPEFATIFERVYLPREASGLRSWVGTADGTVALHISLSLEPFSDGTQRLTGGLPADLMADESHRDFWGPIKLARRMVADVRKGGNVDFILTSFLPAAEGVFRATGFKPFGELRRHVLPLVWPYPLLRRLLHGERRPRLTAVPFADLDVDARLRGLASPGAFRTLPGNVYYRTRMPRQEYPAGTWLLAGDPGAPSAAVLVSPKPRGELLVADILWRDPDPRLAGLLSAVARWGRRAGHRTLSLTTMRNSALAGAALRAGFLLRPDPYPLTLLRLGDATIPPPERWAFTPFVLTAW